MEDNEVSIENYNNTILNLSKLYKSQLQKTKTLQNKLEETRIHIKELTKENNKLNNVIVCLHKQEPVKVVKTNE
jgi:hypothetical protein